MKARLATALSIAGIVVTGGAAFAMNSSILDTDSTAQGSPALATVVAVDPVALVSGTGTPTAVAPALSGATASASQIAESMTMEPKATDTKVASETLKPLALAPGTATATPPSTAEASSPPPTATSTSAPAPVVRQFNVEDFATIFLTANGTQLIIDRVVLAPGSPYTVSNKYVSGDTVRITLASPSRTVEFSARLTNGEIVAAISNPTSALLPPPRYHDDDDHEEREHDEDHEEREYDEDHDREDDDD